MFDYASTRNFQVGAREDGASTKYNAWSYLQIERCRYRGAAFRVVRGTLC